MAVVRRASDHEFSIRRRDLAGKLRAILQRQVQMFRGFDPDDCVPLNGHVTGKFRLDQQRLAVSGYNTAAQAVSIFQRDLVGNGGRRIHCQYQ